MSNQLTIPFKTARPVDIPTAVRSYIQYHRPDTHPDAFRWDIGEWENLRKAAVAGGVHVSKIQALLK